MDAVSQVVGVLADSTQLARALVDSAQVTGALPDFSLVDKVLSEAKTHSVLAVIAGLILVVIAFVSRVAFSYRGLSVEGVFKDKQSLLKDEQPAITLACGAIGLSLIVFGVTSQGWGSPGLDKGIIGNPFFILLFVLFLISTFFALRFFKNKRAIIRDFKKFLDPAIMRLSLFPPDAIKRTEVVVEFILKSCALSRGMVGDVRAMISVPDRKSDAQNLPSLKPIYYSSNASKEEAQNWKPIFSEHHFRNVIRDLHFQELTGKDVSDFFFYYALNEELKLQHPRFPKERLEKYKQLGIRSVWGIPFFKVLPSPDQDQPISGLSVELQKPLGVLAFGATFELNDNQYGYVKELSHVQSKIIGCMLSQPETSLFDYAEGIESNKVEPGKGKGLKAKA